MTSNYQQGRNDVKDAKDKIENVSDKAQQNIQGAKDRAEGAWDKTKEYAQSGSTNTDKGVWEKTKEVASDVKDSISQTASNLYDKAKDAVSTDTTNQGTKTTTTTHTTYSEKK